MKEEKGDSTILGPLNIPHRWAIDLRHEITLINRRECSKKFVQQGRELLARSRRVFPLFGARSVLLVREHSKMARTPLAAFFNIPILVIGKDEQVEGDLYTLAGEIR